MKVHIIPTLNPSEADPGNGGIGRVIRGQLATLPALGWEVTDDPAEADVIHCHVEIPATYRRLYPSKPFVVTCHGAYWTDGGYKWEPWCYQTNQRVLAAVRSADMTVAVSEWVANSLRRNTSRDVRVVYHGVDLDEWQPREGPRGRYVLWNKTRVDPICDTAPMNAAAALLPRVPFVSTFGLPAQNIELTGRLPYEQGKELVRNAGVYLATTRETFGIGTLEALAAGVPVVGFAFGGQVEIIEHGVDGWLARPGDHEGLAEGIEWALAHGDEIAPRARAKAERFSVAATGAQYAALYAEAVERKAREISGPRVSVIVPAYRMGDWLEEALESVRQQDTGDWECIVVNDASPDPRDHLITARFVEADERFREIILGENSYLAAARNAGIAAAAGRYILPLDADDRLTRNTLSVLAGALDDDPALHIAYGGVFFTDTEGKPMTYPGGHAPGHSGWPVEFNLEWMLRGPGQLMPYASMFRRSVWDQTGGYRTRSRSSEDQDFFLRAVSYGFTAQMVTTADTLVYRVRPGSMSSPEGEGWEDHRPWFPWCRDRALLPAGAIQAQRTIDALPFPALDPVAIAVVIPVGPGHGRYVLDAIDSVDAQTFRNFECIVVNDSGEELPRLPRWVRVLCSDPRCPCVDGDPCHYHDSHGTPAWHWPGGRGAAAARNRGIQSSRAPFFLPLDADDYLQPRALEIFWAVAIEGDKPMVIYSDFWEDPKSEGVFSPYECPDYEPRMLIRNGVLHAVTALTPRTFWEEVGGYDETIAWEDWAFAIAIAAKGRCSRRVAAPLFTYRKHTGLRRNANLADFEASKAAIMAKDFGMTGGELMACTTCGGGRATTSMGFMPFQQQPGGGNRQPPEDAVLLRYTGPNAGTFRFRSKVNGSVTYAFSASRTDSYVHRDDAAALLQRPDFIRVDDAQRVEVEELRAAPALIAARTPSMPAASDGPSGAGPMSIGAPSGLPEAPRSPDGQASERTPSAVATLERPPREPDGRAAALANQHSREELNAIAIAEGVVEPDGLSNKTAVATAIIMLREMKAS